MNYDRAWQAHNVVIPIYELEPYKGTEFLAKGRSGVSIEFQRDVSGTVTGVAATLPYGVFNASKKA